VRRISHLEIVLAEKNRNGAPVGTGTTTAGEKVAKASAHAKPKAHQKAKAKAPAKKKAAGKKATAKK
jgi:hypothetical protein